MATRSPFEARKVTSRRGGPVKTPLSRELIVDTTLALMTREGLQQVSLRKVAALLDTGPASLYAYVENLPELQALVLDRALAAVEIIAAPTLPWRARFNALIASYFDVLMRSPGLAQLAMQSIATGPNAMRILEALLGLLSDAGVDRLTAPWAVDLIQLLVTANAAEKTNWRNATDPLATLVRDIGGVSEAEYPTIYASREQLLSGAGGARFEWALEVLLQGILKAPAPRPNPMTPLASRKRAAAKVTALPKPQRIKRPRTTRR